MKRMQWRILTAVTVLSAAFIATQLKSEEARSDAQQNAVTQVVAAADDSYRDKFDDKRPEYRDLVPIVRAAIWGRDDESQEAVKKLRAIGPSATEFLFVRRDLAGQSRYRAVIDEVAQQKDAVFSGLHWYPDLHEALAVAKKEGKPVLSLRLLGNLTEEMSCANSRFFRTALYPHPAVRDVLAKQFVLHWQSVRPAPVITIDFADGRQIRQTITGNSLHMVLDPNGRPLDVLPGLYGAGEFARQLHANLETSARLAPLLGDEFQRALIAEHNSRRDSARKTLLKECRQLKDFGIVDEPKSDADWVQLATLYQPESTPVGRAAEAVTEKGGVRTRNGKGRNAREAGAVAMTKMVVELPMFAGMKKLSETIALDTVKNEFLLHRSIHEHFAATPTLERDKLVEYVYSQIFMSPLDDEWYGLSQPDIYAALPNNGRVNAVTQNPRR